VLKVLLGVITDVTIDAEAYSPTRQTIIAGFLDRAHAWSAMNTINAFKEGPASVDFIDDLSSRKYPAH
jgi:hypothetical protein